MHRQGGRQLRLVEFDAGFSEPDWCCNGHVGYVLDGAGRLEFPDHEVMLQSGDGIFIPPGQEHRHKLTVLTDRLRAVLVEEIA
jgi:quercetin dioxygenase-like cupin family protein